MGFAARAAWSEPSVVADGQARTSAKAVVSEMLTMKTTSMIATVKQVAIRKRIRERNCDEWHRALPRRQSYPVAVACMDDVGVAPVVASSGSRARLRDCNGRACGVGDWTRP